MTSLKSITPCEGTEGPKVPHWGALVELDELGRGVELGAHFLGVDVEGHCPVSALLEVLEEECDLVLDRPLERPCRLVVLGQLGGAEVDEFEVPVAVQHEVLELEVAVGDAAGVQGLEDGDDLEGVAAGLVGGELWSAHWWP